MAVNPITGIDAAVDRFVIFRVSTNQITNMNATWPRTDGGPLVGANPDFRYFKKVVSTPPDIDHRYTLTTTTGMVNATPAAPEGHPFGTWETIYEPVRLPLEDLIAQIETEYQRQVRLQFPETENPSTIVNVGGILIKQQQGAVLTTEETATLARFVAVRDNLVQLAERREEFVAAATADQDYDLTDWPVLS